MKCFSLQNGQRRLKIISVNINWYYIFNQNNDFFLWKCTYPWDSYTLQFYFHSLVFTFKWTDTWYFYVPLNMFHSQDRRQKLIYILYFNHLILNVTVSYLILLTHCPFICLQCTNEILLYILSSLSIQFSMFPPFLYIYIIYF